MKDPDTSRDRCFSGQKFLIGLTQRESRNPQFDFLKPGTPDVDIGCLIPILDGVRPTHALFGYFTSLVDA